MTKLWKSWRFYLLIYTFTRSIWSLGDYQCPMLRLLFSILCALFSIQYSCCSDSYQGVDHPARQNCNQTGLDSVSYTRISSRRMREGRRPTWSIPLSDICSRCPRSWWMLDHRDLAQTSLVGSSTWNIETFYLQIFLVLSPKITVSSFSNGFMIKVGGYKVLGCDINGI